MNVVPKIESALTTGPEGRRPRVLAVDDQRDSLRLLETRLRAAGMECIPFSDGLTALKFLAAEPVDVVILDVMMPAIDGFELCRRIKADEKTRDIPVLFLTAQLDQREKVRGLEVGGHDYLSKPVDQAELVARTQAALRVKYLQDRLKDQVKLQTELNRLHQEKLREHWQVTLGQLASSLAHEINNPLAVALGSIQLLELEPGLRPEYLEHIQHVDSSLQRVAQKLRSLLLMAQPTESIEEADLAVLAEDLVALVNYSLVVNKVRLIPCLERSCQWVGAPSLLTQALFYVLNNAIEAVSGRAEATICLSLERAGKELVFRVADNGPGIPEAIRQKVFEPFFTTKEPPHHGAGLYLAREIVSKFQGSILLESTPSFGRTEVTLRLPAA